MRQTRRSNRESETDPRGEQPEPLREEVERALAALYGDDDEIIAGTPPRRGAPSSQGGTRSAEATT